MPGVGRGKIRNQTHLIYPPCDGLPHCGEVPCKRCKKRYRYYWNFLGTITAFTGDITKLQVLSCMQICNFLMPTVKVLAAPVKVLTIPVKVLTIPVKVLTIPVNVLTALVAFVILYHNAVNHHKRGRAIEIFTPIMGEKIVWLYLLI